MSVTAPSTWQDIIRDLQRSGYTYNRIAIECQLHGVAYTMEAVAALARGRKREPHWSPGNVIMQLHIKHCRTTLPSE